MRIESSVTAVSWIPSEAIEGLVRLPFDLGIGHVDRPLPDHFDDLEALRRADAFRFANELRAFVEVEDGRITAHGHVGGGHLGSTTLRFGPVRAVLAATAFPEIRRAEASPTSVRFTQTAGGRPGMPLPRRVDHKPMVQIAGPTVWTTLALTISADGTSTVDLAGASTFPRHWVYGPTGDLVAKSATIDFRHWYRSSFGHHTPWGDEDSPAVVSTAGSALERRLAAAIMGGKPSIRRVAAGEPVLAQGEAGEEVVLVLDGVVAVEVDGRHMTSLGPGAVVGERAALEGGPRTATVRAVSDVKVAGVPSGALDAAALAKVATADHAEVKR